MTYPNSNPLRRFPLVGLLFVAGLALVSGPTRASGQSRCMASDSSSSAEIVALKRMMTSTDTRWTSTRDAYSLPVVSDTAIVLISDTSLCGQAADAYNAALPAALQVSNRSVYVIRVGSSRYVVWDPQTANSSASEFQVLMVLDQTFAVLAKFAT